MHSVSLELEPLDVLFFRDARPFDARCRATTSIPLPQTVAGAVRTWLLNRTGADFHALGLKIRSGAGFMEATAAQGGGVAAIGRLAIQGPWFVMDGERLTPTPATIEAGRDGTLYRLDPCAEDDLPGWAPPVQGMVPLWRRSRVPATPRGGYLRPNGLQRFLAGGIPLADEVVDADAVFCTEDRVGIVVDPEIGTAGDGDGDIYATRLLRLGGGVTLAVDLMGDTDDLKICPGADVIPLGGEARRAIVRRAGPWRWPAIASDEVNRPLVLLTTPAPFGGWKPPTLSPVAAAVPGPIPVSGWDLVRRGPKPNRFAVPAGSVFFLADGDEAAPGGHSLCDGEDGAVGWGAYVKGTWNHA